MQFDNRTLGSQLYEAESCEKHERSNTPRSRHESNRARCETAHLLFSRIREAVENEHLLVRRIGTCRDQGFKEETVEAEGLDNDVRIVPLPRFCGIQCTSLLSKPSFRIHPRCECSACVPSFENLTDMLRDGGFDSRLWSGQRDMKTSLLRFCLIWHRWNPLCMLRVAARRILRLLRIQDKEWPWRTSSPFMNVSGPKSCSRRGQQTGEAN